MGLHNIQTQLRDGQFSSDCGIMNTPEGILVAWDDTSPTAAAVGYAPGGLWIDTSGAAVYRNTGTKASATWTVFSTSAATLQQSFAANSLGVTGAANSSVPLYIGDGTDQLAIYTNSGNMVIASNHASDITIAPDGGDTTVTGTLTVSGNTTLSGALAVTGNITGTFAGTWAGTTWSGNPSVSLTATTGTGFTIDGATVTSGTALYIPLDASMTGGSGYVMRAYNTATTANALTVASDGSIVIAGTASGTESFKMTAGDANIVAGNLKMTAGNATLTDGTLTLTSGEFAATAADGNAATITPIANSAAIFIPCPGTYNVSTGAIDINASTGSGKLIDLRTTDAFTGDHLYIAPHSTAVAANAISIVGTGTRTKPLISMTDAAPGSGGGAISITSTSAHGSAIPLRLIEAGTSTNPVQAITYTAASTGDALNITMNNAGAAAQAIVVSTNVAHTSPTVSLTTVGGNGGDALSIASTSAHAGGSAIAITETGTVASNLVEIAYGGAHTGDAININMASAGAGAQAIVVSSSVNNTSPTVSLTTVGGNGGDALSIASTSSHAGGSAIAISESGTVASNIVEIALGGAHTGDAININLAGGGAGAQALVISSNVAATSPMVSLTSVGGNGGDAIKVASTAGHAGSSAIAITETGTVASNIVEIAYSGAHTGDAVNINMSGAAATAQGIVFATDVASSGAINSFTSSGALAGGTGKLMVLTADTGTIASATSGFVLDVVDTTGAKATSYALRIASTSNEGLHVDAGKSMFDEVASFKGLNTSEYATNYIAAGGANNVFTATIADAAAANITLRTGTEVYLAMGASLQLAAGGANFALNGGAAAAIVKASDPGSNCALTYGANSVMHLIYNGEKWLSLTE